MSVSGRLYKQSARLPTRQPLSWPVFLRQVLWKDTVLRIAVGLSLVGLLLLAVLCRLARPEPIARVGVPRMDIRPRDAAVYLAVFALAALAVFNLADYRIAFAISVVVAGVSAGGCGTLIASMASLISYKLYVRSGGGKRRFLVYFTIINLLFLAVMTAAYLLFPPR